MRVVSVVYIDDMAYIPYNKGEVMKKFVIEFYVKKDGKIPVEKFIISQNRKMKARILRFLEILQEKGNHLREPYSKHIEDGIFELRIKSGTDISRLLYFFYYEGKIVVTNGFIKKSQKTPKKEIETAKRYREDYIARLKNEKI